MLSKGEQGGGTYTVTIDPTYISDELVGDWNISSTSSVLIQTSLNPLKDNRHSHRPSL